MTRFAADVDLGPACLELIGGGIVILAHVGRVAVGAHEVPILRWTRPVQLVLVSDPLVGVKVKPALAAFFLRPRVPGDGQRLKPTIRELDQVLLQWCYTEGVLHLISRRLAVTTLGVDEKLSTALKEGGSESGISKLRVVEIT